MNTVGLSEVEVKRSISFLEILESKVSEILDAKSGVKDSELQMLEHALSRCRDYAWALQTYPVFDPEALQMQKIQKVRLELMVEGNRKIVDVELQVPTFGVCSWSVRGGRQEFQVNHQSTWGSNGPAIAEALGVDKDRSREAASRLQYSTQVNISATCPIPPASIVKHVERVKERFDELSLAWEAEWANAPVRDPLVIGRINKTHFLIDKFDASKLERYVASEFTRNVSR